MIVSFFGNRGGTRYEIDQNTDIDSDLDGISDNDVDNKDSSSYTDGSAYAITDFSVNESPTRTIKITGFAGNTPIGSKILSIKLGYIKTTSSVSGE